MEIQVKINVVLKDRVIILNIIVKEQSELCVFIIEIWNLLQILKRGIELEEDTYGKWKK